MQTKFGYFIYLSKYIRGKNADGEECLKAVFYNKKKGKDKPYPHYQQQSGIILTATLENTEKQNNISYIP